MIELVYSNRTERLLDKLAEDLNLNRKRIGEAHPLEPIEMVTPNRNMETWVRFNLAQITGVAANLHFRRIERFINDILSEVVPGEIQLVDLDTIEGALLAVLSDDNLLEKPELQPVCRYLQSSDPWVNLPFISSSDNPEANKTSDQELLAADGADLRRVQLASRMAYLFQEYTFSRPEMIAAWRENKSIPGSKTADRYSLAGSVYADPAAIEPSLASGVTWQRALWQSVFGSGGILEKFPPSEGGRWSTLDLVTFDDKLFDLISKTQLPPVHIFGVSYMARIFQLLFARLGETATLRIYTLNPCAEFWEDVETHRELFYRLNLDKPAHHKKDDAVETEAEDPFGLLEADTPALRYWGRPGREHMRLLDELTDCNFESTFDDPLKYGGGLLNLLQQDILMREPERNLSLGQPTVSSDGNRANNSTAEAIKPLRPDQTIKLVAAPSVRREVEWVADEIWKLMREDKQQPGETPLRFSDVAVIVNSAEKETYLPQIESVFAACHNLPNSVSDLSGVSGSRIIEAMSLLLKLPFGRFSRAEMLNVMSHSAITGHFKDLFPHDLADIADKLNIIYGADHGDHAGTYIDEDVLNWDQGIKRLALGACMTGDKSGDDRIFKTAGGRWLVEEIHGEKITAAARFGLLARSLLADARFVREKYMTITDWAAFFIKEAETYLDTEESSDERDLLRLTRSLAGLEKMDFKCRVSGRTATELALRSLDKLGAGHGQYLAEGVVVSSFLPMRAIPFKIVFLLGLGEGLFPASGRRDALDLRAARRRSGDVDPSERDRYMFLETLLCAREKLYISYVRRDEQTGDPLQPSAVIQELLHILKHGYLGEVGINDLRIEPQLRRYNEKDALSDSFIDEARIEARVQEIALDWQKMTYPSHPDSFQQEIKSNSNPGNILGDIREAVPPETWNKLSKILALPGEPPLAASVKAAGMLNSGTMVTPEEDVITLSLSALRRFLECPMQGWAAVMLGLAESEDDPADIEEEDFEINPMVETRLLRDLFFEASALDLIPADLYRQHATKLRLQGKIPVGALGQVIEKRHFDIIAGWETGLADAFGMKNPSTGNAAEPIRLHRIRFGSSYEQGACEKVLEPLEFKITVEGPDKLPRHLKVKITGLTDGLTEDLLTSINFQPKKLPQGKDQATLGRTFRYLLRGIIDHAALAAAEQTKNAERRILSLYALNPAETGLRGLQLKAMDPQKARSWFADILTALIGSAHDYLLPCEAVFFEYYKRRKGQPDGKLLTYYINELAENSWARFSSLWGPVPLPRQYSPPSADKAAEMVSKRFSPLFEDIITMEGF